MKEPFQLIFFVLVMLWVGFIVIADGPQARTERLCSPVYWVGKFTVSMASLSSKENAQGVANWFDARLQNCRLVIWNQFYADEWKRLMQEQAAQQQGQAQ